MVRLPLLILIYEFGGFNIERVCEFQNGREVGFRDLARFDVYKRSVGDTSCFGQLLLCHELPTPHGSHIFS